jgi:MFS family permease
MSGAIAEVQMILLAICAAGVLAGLGLSPPASLLVRRLRSWAPASRHRALALVAVAPAAHAFAFVVAALLPSLLSLVDPAFDHCRTHDDGHAHMCLIHLPQSAAGGVGWLLASLPIAWLAAGCADDLWAIWQARSTVRRLHATCRQSPLGSFLELPVEYPLCASVGLWNPVVVVSSGLSNTVRADVLEAAIEHERAHVRRRDTLIRLVARAATLLYWPSVRRRILAALELAAEQACDEEAAETAGDRLKIAESILAVERVLSCNPAPAAGPLASSFAAVAAVQRVESLVADRLPRRSTIAFVLAICAGAVALLLFSPHVHHATESLLSSLLH